MPRPLASTVAAIRLANTKILLEEFKAAAGTTEDLLKMPEQTFAARLKISASMWSQLKGGHRSIGNTLARQFEGLFGKPLGWLDVERRTDAVAGEVDRSVHAVEGPKELMLTERERFAVDLFLIAYRSNPDLVSSRLLDVVHLELAKSEVAKNVRSIRSTKTTNRA